MSIRFEYPPLVKKKVQRVIDWAYGKFPKTSGENKNGRQTKDVNRDIRNDAVVARIGLNLGYLEGIGRQYREPSGRVMKNLGIEIWVKDLETGEMELVDFFGRCEIDHSDPAEPKKFEE